MPKQWPDCVTDSYAHGVPTIPQQDGMTAWANMGYVGFVRLYSPKLSALVGASAQPQMLRVTDFGMALRQEIEKPNVIDGRIDRTTYQLGPKIVEGTMSLPLYADTLERGQTADDNCPTQEDLNSEGESGPAGRLVNLIWCWSTGRDKEGRMAHSSNLDVRYANHAAFSYDTCVVNELTLRAAEQDLVTVDIDMMGRARSSFGEGGQVATGEPNIQDYLSPARVLTWNDVTVTGIGGCSSMEPGEVFFYSNTIRNWELRVANGLDRFFTFNGSLFPADINAGVRDVTGSIELMGLSNALRAHTSGDSPNQGLQSHFTEKNELRFAFYIGEETYQGNGAFTSRDWIDADNPVGTPIFSRRLMAVIYEIEEMTLSNDLFTTSINYHALAIDNEAIYEFVNPVTSYFPVWY